MRQTEYTVPQLKTLLDDLSGMYDLARVVDPVERRILELSGDGGVSMDRLCYGIWDAGQKCVHCSSKLACQTGCHQQKTEFFRGHVYQIQSNPVRLRLPDGDACDRVISRLRERGFVVEIDDFSKGNASLGLLKAMGCRCFQGFYFSRPVPVAEFESRLAAIPRKAPPQ